MLVYTWEDKMVKIVFIDDDIYYCKTVCDSLSRMTDSFSFGYISDTKLSEDVNVVYIYNPSCKIDPDCFKHKIMLLETHASADWEDRSIFKYTSRKEMLDTIKKYTKDCPDLAFVPTTSGLSCIVGNACHKLKNFVISEIVSEKTAQGYKTVRLDIAPPYICDQKDISKSSYTLTDALLRISANDLSTKDIGLFLTVGQEGFLQFRTVERTDDLFECSPEQIQKLVKIIGEWIANNDYGYYFLINFSHVPFSFIYSCAILGDNLYIINTNQEKEKTALYNSELSHLISNIPDTCKVLKKVVKCTLDNH